MAKRNKRKGSKYRRKQNEGAQSRAKNRNAQNNGRLHAPRLSSRQIADKYKDEFGEDYELRYMDLIAYPFYRVRLSVMASGKPDNDVIRLHLILLRMASMGMASEEQIKAFLGLVEPYFVVDELYTLVREKALAPGPEDKYQLTGKGKKILDENASIIRQVKMDFSFAIDGATMDIIPYREIRKASSEKKFPPPFEGKRPEFKWLTDNWNKLVKAFKRINPKMDLVDFGDLKKSIQWAELVYEDYYVLGYVKKEQEDDFRLTVRDTRGERKQLSKEGPTTDLFNSLPELFLGDDTQELVLEHQEKFEEEREQIRQEIQIVPKEAYKELTNFEVRKEMEGAIRNTKSALLIESPWIRRATDRFIPELKKLLERECKLCILYGISMEDQHHSQTLRKLENLQSRFGKKQFLLVNLPQHFEDEFLENMTGTHRKILLKDDHLTIKGSFNYLSNNAEEDGTFAAEEATVFYSGTQQRWEKMFEEYHLPKGWLNWFS